MNKSSSKNLYNGLYKFSIIVSIGVLFFSFVIPDYVYHLVWVLLLFFVLLTMASLFVLQRASNDKSKNFLASYFTIMIGRLFISVIFASLFILLDKSHVFNFAISFLILYLLFLGFEIVGIMTNLRHHFKKGTDDA